MKRGTARSQSELTAAEARALGYQAGWAEAQADLHEARANLRTRHAKRSRAWRAGYRAAVEAQAQSELQPQAQPVQREAQHDSKPISKR